MQTLSLFVEGIELWQIFASLGLDSGGEAWIQSSEDTKRVLVLVKLTGTELWPHFGA